MIVNGVFEFCKLCSYCFSIFVIFCLKGYRNVLYNIVYNKGLRKVFRIKYIVIVEVLVNKRKILVVVVYSVCLNVFLWFCEKVCNIEFMNGDLKLVILVVLFCLFFYL